MRISSICLFTLSIGLAAAGTLDTRAGQAVANFPGHVSVYALNLDTGVSYGLKPDEPVRTASTIKLPIMIECFYQAEKGALQWTEPLSITGIEKVSGSGVISELSDNVQLPIRDLMHLMIVVSDNTATNLILNRITGDAVNARMASLGLTQTRNMRKILRGDAAMPAGITHEGAKPENQHWGIGRSSPREMVTLLQKLYRGELVSAAASKEMLEVLKRQQDHNGIARDLKDVTVANKSGALDHLRSDVGIVYTKRGAVAMAITVDEMPQVDWSPDNAGELLISKLSEMLITELIK